MTKRFVMEVYNISTIKDVAKYTGLSIATISKYINGGNVLDENKKIIQEAIEVLDYKRNEMARGLKTNKTMTIGVLLPSLENIFFTSIVSIIEGILQEKGYGTIICDFKEDKELEHTKLEFLINKHVDGIIMVSYSGEKKHIQSLLDKKIPVILLDRMIKGLDCDIVIADNLNASYQAVEELIMRKHKRIGIICGPENTYTADERRKGYIRVHEDYNVDIDEELIKNADYTVVSGYKALIDLWNMDKRPSAVLVTNYEMTIGAIMAVNDLNITIPNQLSLIGFDNIQMARIVRPPLSIVEQPMKEIGETAANLMLKRLSDDYSDFPSTYRLKTKVHIKESVSTNI
ncbi:LacI family DNA-binding transcriptional regulator [Vallitalea guaymasensis]|uniref:LacI family DNA-binding transcriptional regulator n=1 Tax=Vallitalea guaymasensis TaxID=1185412 RepID=UPI002357EB13|nr:LacI family DNA-binding transcriptional regulator [Vallitalea guaymasensis]